MVVSNRRSQDKTLHVESGYKIGILKFFSFNFFLSKTLGKSSANLCFEPLIEP